MGACVVLGAGPGRRVGSEGRRFVVGWGQAGWGQAGGAAGAGDAGGGGGGGGAPAGAGGGRGGGGRAGGRAGAGDAGGWGDGEDTIAVHDEPPVRFVGLEPVMAPAQAA